MQVVAEQQIACTPEVAFDLMADARNEPEWNSQVSATELKSGEPIAAGSQFVIVNRGEAFDATILTYDRPGRSSSVPPDRSSWSSVTGSPCTTAARAWPRRMTSGRAVL